MGILTYIKLGACLAVVLVASYFFINYKHMQNKIATLEAQVAAQADSIKYYEKTFNIEQETKNVHEEIIQAANANDIPRMLDLYRQLRSHQRTTKGQISPPANDDTE